MTSIKANRCGHGPQERSFRRGDARPPEPRFQHFNGTLQQPPQGTRMPRFQPPGNQRPPDRRPPR